MPTLAPSSRERAPFADARDLDDFLEMLARFERGEVTAEAWRQYRLLLGTYGQRQPGDVHMQRVKIPQGVLSAAQLEALAEVAVEHGRGFGHVTTRQNLQLHFVAARGAEAAMRRLVDAGITTREACGNSVRNVTACPLAGVSAREAFDVTPYAEAFTRHFLRHPLSSTLPRKFKVAFEGCPDDHAACAIHDLGFFARTAPDGRRGFLVRAGGGTATVPVAAQLLVDFLPAEDVLELSEAVIRVFHRLGDRVHRHANRMKFLIRKLGFEGFRAEVEAERSRVRADGAPRLSFDVASPPEELAPEGTRPAAPGPEAIAARVRAQAPRGPGLVPAVEPDLAPAAALRAAFERTNVRPQRQAGWVVVEVVLPLGDVTAAQLSVLADLSRAYGDGTVRFTREQDVVLRWVRREEVGALHARLAAAGLGRAGAGTAARVTSCPGAESCKLAVTQSRGLGRLLEEHVRAHPELALPELDLKVSGCPNGCGQHHVAAIGFQGSARKVDGRAIPQYFVLLGGAVGPDGARFGRLAAKIPARRVPEALDRLVALYAADRAVGESAPAFFARVDPARARAVLADLAELAPDALRPEDLVDLGDAAAFRPESGDGECAT
ncbi:nitrite/sulfite reductase [Anaeromyxobacter oryzae]|uniref:Ferredoxin--nitrite reductase n=1 Tax=Anaeromyxobacter oryzae TaxID=2918170 RepID=A0ABM7WP03_9BACT|nr:nitrite/sulfite reductase [Anaeromyxobacter oryzae]BDG01188.1 ferredoxin--nitrite reductase [Anaeromyxobacter oryzae]